VAAIAADDGFDNDFDAICLVGKAADRDDISSRGL